MMERQFPVNQGGCGASAVRTGRPDVSPDFKVAMRRLASTITIVSAAHEGQRYGMTATAVSSVTTSPPSLLTCVNRSASIHDPIHEGKRYCINLLGCDHVGLVPLFSGKLMGEERFTAGTWSANADGIPYLTDAQASIFCTVDQVMQYGTHSIFIGLVDEVMLFGETRPLIYQDGMMFKTVSAA